MKNLFFHLLLTARKKQENLAVCQCDTLDGLLCAVDEGADIIYLEMRTSAAIRKTHLKKHMILHLGQAAGYILQHHLLSGKEMDELYLLIREALKIGFCGVLAGNLGILRADQQLGGNIIIDYSLNVFNHRSFSFFYSGGAEVVTLSPELTLEQVSSLSRIWNCGMHGSWRSQAHGYGELHRWKFAGWGK